jgi:hypothetical protein
MNKDSNAATDLSRSKVQDGDKVSIYPHLRVAHVISSAANKMTMEMELGSHFWATHILYSSRQFRYRKVHSSPQVFLQRLKKKHIKLDCC